MYRYDDDVRNVFSDGYKVTEFPFTPELKKNEFFFIVVDEDAELTVKTAGGKTRDLLFLRGENSYACTEIIAVPVGVTIQIGL